MGVPVGAAQHLPLQHPGPADLVRGARLARPAISAARGGVDLMVAMNPQTWDQDVAEIEPGGYLFYDSTKPLPPSKFRDDITVIGVPLTEICNAALYRSARSASCSRTSSMSARWRRCSTSSSAVVEQLLIAEQFKGKDKLIAAELRGAAAWAATMRAGAPRLPDRPAGPRAPTRSATASSSRATPPPALGAVYGGATVCAWYPITPSTSLAEAFDQLLPALPHRPGDRQEPLRHRPGRGRARLDRHGDRRRLERRARLHRDLRPRHLADAGVPRPRLFRRDPGGDLRRAARRPVDRHADAHPAVRPAVAPPMPATATPSTCCCFPADPHECFEFGAAGLRPRRPAADRRSSSCSTSTSA